VKLLENFGFITVKGKAEIPISFSSYSTNRKIPFECRNYTIIQLIDNPYRNIINRYREISRENWILKSADQEKFENRFNEWCQGYFEDLEHLVNEGLIDYFTFQQFIFSIEDVNSPHFYVRSENMEEDLQKIPLFNNTDIQVREIFFPPFYDDYKDIFSEENAKKLFWLNRDFFMKTGYDPFSFSTKEFSLKKKVDFIHN
jgi:hypothetical protein